MDSAFAVGRARAYGTLCGIACQPSPELLAQDHLVNFLRLIHAVCSSCLFLGVLSC